MSTRQSCTYDENKPFYIPLDDPESAVPRSRVRMPGRASVARDALNMWNSPMTLRVWLFVLFVLKWAVPIVACTFVVLAALNVSDNLTDCRLSHEAAKIYIKDNCHVGENMNRKGIMLECKRRFDIRDRETPASCAWRAWVEDLVGCTSRSCIESLRVSTWTFVSWFAAILVFLLAAYMFLDRWLARGTAELYNQQRIPSTYDVDDSKMH